ncbi:MAG: hypothetical protein LAQ69_45160 [Acidobacteriia bacterium]|nr:hypothetical protein [Terriglobia bacterium]
MTVDELRAQKRDTILAIAARHGVTSIPVFGSFARAVTRTRSAPNPQEAPFGKVRPMLHQGGAPDILML